jgi:hypothetical protein
MADNFWVRSEQEAANVSILDSGGHFTSTSVEGALQEVSVEIDTIDAQNVKLTGNQTVEGIKTFSDAPVLSNGIELTAGRKAFDELTSGTLTTSGWYTIAESDPKSFDSLHARFCTQNGGSGRSSSFSFDVDITTASTARTNDNTSIKITGLSKDAAYGVTSARLAKSDTVAGSGVKVQVKLDISTTLEMTTLIAENISDSGTEGFQLVPPYLDNAPTLPDGVTAATFLEAGTHISLVNGVGGQIPINAIGRKTSNDNVRFTFPSQNILNVSKTLVDIDETLITAFFVQGGGVSSANLLTGNTYSIVGSVQPEYVVVDIGNVGAFTSIPSNTMLVISMAGTGSVVLS